MHMNGMLGLRSCISIVAYKCIANDGTMHMNGMPVLGPCISKVAYKCIANDGTMHMNGMLGLRSCIIMWPINGVLMMAPCI